MRNLIANRNNITEQDNSPVEVADQDTEKQVGSPARKRCVRKSEVRIDDRSQC